MTITVRIAAHRVSIKCQTADGLPMLPGCKGERVNSEIGTCVLCKQFRPMRNRGFCSPCYHKARREGTFKDYALPKKKQPKYDHCCDCDEYAHIQGRGRCKSCYGKWYYSRPEAKQWHREYERKRRQARPEEYRATEYKRSQTERRLKWQHEYNRTYYASHAGALRAYARQWRRDNPEMMKHYNRNSRQSRKIADGYISIAQWVAIVIHYCPDHCCPRCGKKFNETVITDKLTIDHVLPIAAGGTHWPENIQPLCYSCNCSKSNHDYTDYRPDRGEFARSINGD